MSEVHPIAPSKPNKPAKPYSDFPLFPHATKRWAKKIRGKLHYFGPWKDPDGALKKYLEQKDALHAGRKPRPETDGLTMKALCNDFLNFKHSLVDSRELAERTWQDYKAVTDLLIAHFGKNRVVDDVHPDDFAELRDTLANKWGAVTLGNVIQRIRVVFKYASDMRLIDRPVCYGQGFKRPSRKTIRLARAKSGPKLFTKEEIHLLLKQAGTHLKAMILLGINAGMGNADVGTLPLSALNLERGWLDYPRPKTGVPRKAKLWPETLQAVRDSLARRPAPKDDSNGGLVFITKYGLPWAKDVPDSPVTKELAKLLHKLHINSRKGLGFYTLRHTFRTVADEVASGDQPAIDYIMGHESPHMSTVYRERISDARLENVANKVREWLFGQ